MPILDRMEHLSRRDFLTRAGLAGAVVLGASAAGTATPAQAAPGTEARRFTIGKSRVGRPIHAYRIGDPEADNRYLVMGQMHGDEPAGPMVVNRLLKAEPLNNVALWLVPTMNPDGGHRGTRTNAKGVDLNRNFPSSTWVKQGKGTRYWSGPRPASEPETRAIVRFFSRVQPRTLISLHQPLASVDFSGGDKEVTRWLSRHLGLPKSHIHISGGGTMTSWFNAEFRKKTAVTVELPPSTSVQYRQRVADGLLRHARHRRV